MIKGWMALAVVGWLMPGLYGQAVSETPEQLPSFDYTAARAHELEPHRRTIPVDGVEEGFNELFLTLTVSPSGDVIAAKADGRQQILVHWPELRDEVMQWKFTPFEVDGNVVTATIQEFLSLVPGERLPTHHVAPPVLRGNSQIEIYLQRSGCYGWCPDYSVRLNPQGIVFNGVSFVVSPGRHVAKADAAEVRALAARFITSDFYSMDPVYRASVSDSPTYAVGIVVDGHGWQVEDYMGDWVGMPAVIRELEEAVDELAGTKRWIEGSDGLVSSLKAEKFDFATYAAQNILRESAEKGQTATVRELLQSGVSLKALPNPKPSDPQSGDSWQDPGWLESAAEQPETLQFLIDAGASRKDQADKDAALARAAEAGNVESAEALIDYGADPNVDLGKLVLTDGRGFKHQGKGEGNVLYYAAESGNPEMVREILQFNPDVNFAGLHGKTPLFGAVDCHGKDGGRVEIVRMLVEAGADVNARDKWGDTPLHSVSLARIDEELIQLGADVNARNSNGETPIFTIAGEDLISLLVRHGADLTIRNEDGQTVFEVSAIQGRPAPPEYLQKAIAAAQQQ